MRIYNSFSSGGNAICFEFTNGWRVELQIDSDDIVVMTDKSKFVGPGPEYIGRHSMKMGDEFVAGILAGVAGRAPLPKRTDLIDA